jgi:two-component system chemotaxis sensor kinase CheA
VSEPEVVKEFLVESRENLDGVDRESIVPENGLTDHENMFRAIHTINGSSRFLAFRKLEAVTHVGEGLLARLREGQLRLNPGITTALLAMVGAVRQMLTNIEACGNEGERDDKALIAALTRLQQVEAATSVTDSPLGGSS